MKRKICRYKSFFVLCFICLANPYFLFAGIYDPVDSRVQPITPQVWSFMVYGNNPFDLYTGTVGVSIPVYTYNDRDFKLPITLNYSSNGFKPNKQSDIVGYDWYLNVGGVITREKRGMYDEKRNIVQGITNKQGYMYYHNLTDTLGFTLRSKQFDQYSPMTLYRYKNSIDYDMEPDIFHFSFLGYKGTFQMGPMGEFYVYDSNYPTGEIKIKRFEASPYNGYPITISIVTGDGYEYIFGGDKYAVDYIDADEEYLELGPEEYDKIGSNAIAMAWHLTKVIAPNKREIIFSYGQHRNIISHYTPKYFAVHNYESLSVPWSVDLSYTNSAQLKSIEIGDWKSEFTYRRREPNEIEKADKNSIIFSSDLLTDINITYREAGALNTIKTCQLSYTRPYKMLLDSVIISGEGVYHMDYFGNGTPAPKIDTYAIDHWGYWNGLATNSTFIPIGDWNWHSTQLESNPDIKFSKSRDVNLEKTKWGMLTDITYPTGGRSHFEYESHDYNWCVKHIPTWNTYVNDYALYLIDGEPGIAGGLRIKSVQNFDKDNVQMSSKRYYYNYDVVNNNDLDRTGILLKYPRYRIMIPYQNGPGNVPTFYLKSDWDIYTYDKSNVEYMKVFEFNSDDSSTEYEFSTWMTNCDLVEYNKYSEYTPSSLGYQSIDPQWKYGVHNLLKKPNSHHSERGHLITKTQNNVWADMIQEEKRIYNYHDVKSVQSPMYTTVDGCYKHKQYIENLTLDSIVYRYKYKSIKTVAYRYNKGKQLTQQINYESDGSVRTLHNVFLHDKENLDAIERKMVEKNVVRSPLDSYTTIRSSNNEYLVDYTKHKYTSIGDLILLQKTDKAFIPNNTPLSDMHSLSFRSDVTYQKYDSFGNVTQTINKSGTNASYLWSSDGLYLEAIIINATLDNINSVFSGLSTQESAGGLNPKKEQLLRQIPGAMVTTYKYKPGVGPTEITNQLGVKIVYTYTPSGKLAAEYDGKGNILRSYEYSTDK